MLRLNNKKYLLNGVVIPYNLFHHRVGRIPPPQRYILNKTQLVHKILQKLDVIYIWAPIPLVP